LIRRTSTLEREIIRIRRYVTTRAGTDRRNLCILRMQRRWRRRPNRQSSRSRPAWWRIQSKFRKMPTRATNKTIKPKNRRKKRVNLKKNLTRKILLPPSKLKRKNQAKMTRNNPKMINLRNRQPSQQKRPQRRNHLLLKSKIKRVTNLPQQLNKSHQAKKQKLIATPTKMIKMTRFRRKSSIVLPSMPWTHSRRPKSLRRSLMTCRRTTEMEVEA